MDARHRVIQTINFQAADRVPYDLMEGCIWHELLAYFQDHFGLHDSHQVIEFLDPDLRWTYLEYIGPPQEAQPASNPDIPKAASKEVVEGPLSSAKTHKEIESYSWSDPAWLGPADYAGARQRWSDKALVFCPGWMPLFWNACELFGVKAAVINMVEHPELFNDVVERQHTYTMDILKRVAPLAGLSCDLAWLGDDFAHQQNMMISPTLWRKHIKPYLAEQVSLLRANGMKVLFHSCGAVRPVLPDLVEIGINALLVFQTTARGMDVQSIARDFGGRLAFYGGIDVQHLLSSGTPSQVKAAVAENIRAFADCGGYIVANSHHTISSIKGENILAMCEAARNSSTHDRNI